jgi:hypothetical protein
MTGQRRFESTGGGACRYGTRASTSPRPTTWSTSMTPPTTACETWALVPWVSPHHHHHDLFSYQWLFVYPHKVLCIRFPRQLVVNVCCLDCILSWVYLLVLTVGRSACLHYHVILYILWQLVMSIILRWGLFFCILFTSSTFVCMLLIFSAHIPKESLHPKYSKP